LPQVDLFDVVARGVGIEIEQRALRDRQPDGALDVAGHELIAALELLIKTLEHAARLFAGVASALDGGVVAARVRGDPEPPLDQGQVLSVLSEQRRRQAVVVEIQHDLGRGVAAGGRLRAEHGIVLRRAQPARLLQGRHRPPCLGAERSEQAVGAGFGNRHRLDPSNERARCHHVNRL